MVPMTTPDPHFPTTTTVPNVPITLPVVATTDMLHLVLRELEELQESNRQLLKIYGEVVNERDKLREMNEMQAKDQWRLYDKLYETRAELRQLQDKEYA
jgi:hypothetical protein